MGILCFPLLFLISILSLIFVNNVVQGKCLEDQRLALVEFKQNITFNVHEDYPSKLLLWNSSTDCCSWAGVTCEDGLVVGLDLSSEGISGKLDDSSSLFKLRHLRSLNLAYAALFTSIPSAIGKLENLMNLNLSESGFFGQIPIEISGLTKLHTLHLSSFFTRPLKLEDPDLRKLVQNLSKLQELNLDGVVISAREREWAHVLAFSLPNLRVLSLSHCHLSGPIDASFVNLHSLSAIHLHGNDFSSPVPKFFANFSNLISLGLGACNLVGKFPEEIFRMPGLQTLDLSHNFLLGGSLPEFIQGGSLTSLILTETNFSGPLPKSIGELSKLSHLELFNCKFSGLIPNSLANLSQLVLLDLSLNMFTGPIPTPHFEGLVKLEWVELSFNSFNGSIPSSLFNLSSLQRILLSNNHFDGLLPKFSNASSSQLDTLELGSNFLQGPIPTSFFDLRKLHILSLSSNNLSGTIELTAFQKIASLTTLDLSYNSLSIETSSNKSNFSKAFPFLSSLKLASCKLKTFPNFGNQSMLSFIDFSDNQIGGDIPSWIWEVNNGYLLQLNLSHNLFVNLQKPFRIPTSLCVLDLNTNDLHGEIPKPPESASYVDYSSNHFSSSIPAEYFSGFPSVYLFSVSSNSLTGSIPESVCHAEYLHVLDLSKNNLSGTIPSCLVERTNNITVLNLAENKLVGNISGTFPSNCNLKTLDLHGNLLRGMIPESLSECQVLEALNLGNNMIADMFPCWLKNLANLRVLVLRSNWFQGNLRCLEANQRWKNLQIIDLACNNFSGVLPTKGFSNFKAMMVHEGELKVELNPLRYELFALSKLYYQDKVKVLSKGLQMELVKILTIYTLIDLSSNMFQGNIPEELGHLTSLYILNLSNNALTGQIPSSFGSLEVLESLDLSKNKLYGVIPSQLAGLTFLSFLNLSFNQLEGMIPKGSQFQTLTEACFQGNKGLCGTPLNVTCPDSGIAGSSPPAYENMHFGANIDWDLIAAEIGFFFGLGIFVVLLVFCKKWRKYYYLHVDQFLSRIFNMQRRGRIRGRKVQRRSI